MVQDFSVVVDSIHLLEKYLRISIKTSLSSYQEIAVKLVDRSKEDYFVGLPSNLYSPDKYFPVILISGWYNTGEKENSYFLGCKPWLTFNGEDSIDLAIDKIDEILKKHMLEWSNDFIKKMGNGYSRAFNNFDGDIEVGYELKKCHCFPEQLAISMKHVYYGK